MGGSRNLNEWLDALWREQVTKFVDRPIESHRLPLPEGATFPHPERVVLVLDNSLSIDFGALCYLRRGNEKRQRGKGGKVELSSFSATRSVEIRALIDIVSDRFAHSGLRPKTVHRNYGDFVQFINWCDSNQHSNVLSAEESARVAFRGYVENLRRLVSQNQIGNDTAARNQVRTLDILEDYLNVEHLSRGINLLMRSGHLDESTPVPDDAAQEKVLAWCTCLLNGFSELIVDRKPFPFRLAVPKYLNWPNDSLWVFPLKRWCEPPDTESDTNYRNYDYRNGRVRTQKEVKEMYGKTKYPSDNNRNNKSAHKYIVEANQDFFHHERIARGMLAVQAFLLMFIASTGINLAQALEMPWNEELEEASRKPATERQQFRTIKYRANSCLMSFEIGIEYMPHLRRYLQLRKHLLIGRRCDYLFFSYSFSRTIFESGPIPLQSSALKQCFKTLKRLSPTLPKVLARQWRAAKQDHVIRNHDPATAARVMQQSQITALRKYSNGSEVSQQIELSSFFSHVEKVVIEKGQEIAGSETRSVGICISPQHPKAIAENLPVKPDCKGSEGCLFCDKYRAHADDTDVRKLLSARYCIRKTSHLTSNQEQFDRLFGRILQRIDFILLEIKRHDLKMVEKVEQEVDIEGEMTPFWSAKLATLMELELL